MVRSTYRYRYGCVDVGHICWSFSRSLFVPGRSSLPVNLKENVRLPVRVDLAS